MLILNAGSGHLGYFNEMEEQNIENITNLNILHVVYTLRVLVNQMITRKERSAVIITSSNTGSVPLPGFNLYSSSKIFESYISRSVGYELRDKIDFISLEPWLVITNQISNDMADLLTITSDRCAEVCLRDLGNTPMTNGAMRHDIATIGFKMLPSAIVNSGIMKKMETMAIELKELKKIKP